MNKAIIRCGASRGDLPIGVHFDKNLGMYRACLSLGPKNVKLGSFHSAEAAFAKYKVAKENKFKSLAEEWKSRVDPRAYAALMTYNVEITD